jgi:hypothetical protein
LARRGRNGKARLGWAWLGRVRQAWQVRAWRGSVGLGMTRFGPAGKEVRMSKSQRTTVSFPLSLKRRMDAIHEDVNWSAIAARAFEREVARHERKQAEERQGPPAGLPDQWLWM